jgi:hypothetical protein
LNLRPARAASAEHLALDEAALTRIVAVVLGTAADSTATVDDYKGAAPITRYRKKRDSSSRVVVEQRLHDVASKPCGSAALEQDLPDTATLASGLPVAPRPQHESRAS